MSMEKQTILFLVKIGLWIGCLYASALFSLQNIFVVFSAFYFIFTNLGKRSQGTLSAYSVFNQNFEKLPGTSNGLELFTTHTKASQQAESRKTSNERMKKQSHDKDELENQKIDYFRNQSRYGNKLCFCSSGLKFKKCCLIMTRNNRKEESKNN